MIFGRRRRRRDAREWLRVIRDRNERITSLKLQVAEIATENIRLEGECSEWHRSAMHFKELADSAEARIAHQKALTESLALTVDRLEREAS